MDVVSGSRDNTVCTMREVFECCVNIFILQCTVLLLIGLQKERRALHPCQGPVDVELCHQAAVVRHT